MRLARTLTVPLLAGLAIVASVTAGCGGSSNSNGDPSEPATDHTNIVLKDRLGNPLTVDVHRALQPAPDLRCLPRRRRHRQRLPLPAGPHRR